MVFIHNYLNKIFYNLWMSGATRNLICFVHSFMNLSPLLNRNTQSIHFVFQFIIDRISSRLTHRIDVCIRIRPNVRIRATPVHKPQRILTRAAVQLDVQIAVTEVRELERRVVSAALVETGPRVVGAVGVDAPVGIQRRRRAVGVPFLN